MVHEDQYIYNLEHLKQCTVEHMIFFSFSPKAVVCMYVLANQPLWEQGSASCILILCLQISLCVSPVYLCLGPLWSLVQ